MRIQVDWVLQTLVTGRLILPQLFMLTGFAILAEVDK
jgi:hypothetical protein